MDNQVAIPKYIHYCWFGGNPLPKQFEKYIATWKKWFPDYEIIRWDESNFPIHEFAYAREAMEAGKMAFVSDVARIYALNKMGGVYFDTDVEVVGSFDRILEGEVAVLGTETAGETIGTGFMAFVPGHPLCQKMLHYYETHSYLEQDSTLSNTIILAELVAKQYGIAPAERLQRGADVVIYPSRYFTAFDGHTGRYLITKDTCCVHHFAASWFSPGRRLKDRIVRFVHRVGNMKKR
ncbi:MAG: glycosyl transferase [Ruminococcaceae bacterium]|nr:glycosyl transferase [Oscillospiraceae bacterium]